MKKLISLFLAVVLCLPMVCAASASSISSGDLSVSDEFFADAELALNLDAMESVFGEVQVDACINRLRISEDKESVEITFMYDGYSYCSTLHGTYDEVQAGSINGYIGVYEGLVMAVDESTETLVDTATPIIADITFNESEMFVALTLGYAAETTKPIILFFGEISEDIAATSNAYATQTLNAAQAHAQEEYSTSATSVDATCRLQGYTYDKMGTHMCGVLSIFHANELRNQNSMTTYVKVNTKSDLVEDYIEDDLGFGEDTLFACADTFNISICGNHDDFHAVVNSYSPQDSATTSTIYVPVYGGDVIGLQIFSFETTMSKTTVTPSKYSSDSGHPNNKLSWYMYKKNGWNPDTFDGGYLTEKGMAVSAYYTYEGNVTSNLSRTMTATASIRYEYWVMVVDTLYSFHLTTDTMSVTSSVTICP